ncbi:unnamed protein product [Fraxinus pennsylvanica]|uniref:Uncharacterized protein n=1 Tax=Fraxinus pennsylvanica TaxID=56036 RepID=A0AAD1ZHV0_9LAMI|nr:unnamed protein product [Fraxinus pennsylvanica]
MNTERKTASILGGKTAKACDSCLQKRARWYCSADDAFLCQSCDASVHSANQLASRHRRVRLESSSFKAKGNEDSGPAWYRGFTRKARTPRQAKSNLLQPSLLVPEINSEETSLVENEDHLLYRVPVFDGHLDADIFTASNPTENDEKGCDFDFQEFVTSDAELAEFAADVESLLGTGLEDSHEIELGLGRMDSKEEDIIEKRVKVEDDEDDNEMKAVIACHLDPALDMARETFNWNSDYESPVLTGEEGEENKVIGTVNINEMTTTIDCQNEAEVIKRMFLRINYEAVIAAWASQGSPWTNGIRPDQFEVNDLLDTFQEGGPNLYDGLSGRLWSSDAVKRAKVSRYREKRRMRLFSKKIRYEVRKLNAEKRPRMKGRFVKRTTSAGSSISYQMNKVS